MRCEQSTLQIKDLKDGPSLSIFAQKIMRRNGQSSAKFYTNKFKASEFDSGLLARRGKEGKNTVMACFSFFGGAKI